MIRYLQRFLIVTIGLSIGMEAAKKDVAKAQDSNNKTQLQASFSTASTSNHTSSSAAAATATLNQKSSTSIAPLTDSKTTSQMHMARLMSGIDLTRTPALVVTIIAQHEEQSKGRSRSKSEQEALNYLKILSNQNDEQGDGPFLEYLDHLADKAPSAH